MTEIKSIKNMKKLSKKDLNRINGGKYDMMGLGGGGGFGGGFGAPLPAKVAGVGLKSTHYKKR